MTEEGFMVSDNTDWMVETLLAQRVFVGNSEGLARKRRRQTDWQARMDSLHPAIPWMQYQKWYIVRTSIGFRLSGRATRFHSRDDAWHRDKRENRSYHTVNLHASQLRNISVGNWIGAFLSMVEINHAIHLKV